MTSCTSLWPLEQPALPSEHPTGEQGDPSLPLLFGTPGHSSCHSTRWFPTPLRWIPITTRTVHSSLARRKFHRNDFFRKDSLTTALATEFPKGITVLHSG